jgi:inosine-uridine nucleoside N-ribohydrolase
LKVFGLIAVVISAALITFALPVTEWRTGDQGLSSMESIPEAATPPIPRRVWIDTDAACGHSPRTDPDDCFAVALLLRTPELDVVGISTVAGNAPREVVDAKMRTLLERLGSNLSFNTDLRAALEQGPLTIVALGPLTNIAAVLRERPDLRNNVARLIAVMGRRPGHLFHPAEGAGGGMLFGHGPVFRDFNFALDPDAVSRVLALQVPISLVPYDAARGIELTAADLDRLQASLPWIVERSRGWLEYWRTDIGRAGFCPFDLLAAAYVVEPSRLRCAAVRARVGEDDTLFWAPTALLVEPAPDGAVLYCASGRGDIKADLMRRLTATRPSTRAGASARRTRKSSS